MNKKITIISLRIMIIFTVAILMSFLPELIPDFFGDVICNKVHTYGGNVCQGDTTHWGYRHWLYFFMGFSLFIVQVVSLIFYINEEVSKK